MTGILHAAWVGAGGATTLSLLAACAAAWLAYGHCQDVADPPAGPDVDLWEIT
jgi:hypothetical protein